MEQIIQNILKSQGYEKIGLIDKEKRIWCYLKNGAIHFCNDDLKPVDWCSFAKDKNLLVLSEIDGSFIIVHDRDVFTNFMVIDNNNRVLIWETSNRYDEQFILMGLGVDSFVIFKKWYLKQFDLSKKGFSLQHVSPDYNHSIKTYSFINGKYLSSYHMRSVFQNVFFYEVEEPNESKKVAIKKGEGIIFEGNNMNNMYLWVHKDGKAQLLTIENDSDKFNYDDNNNSNSNEEGQLRDALIKIHDLDDNITSTYRTSNYIAYKDIQNSNVELYEYEFGNQLIFSNNYFIIPFSGRYGAFVITYDNQYLSPSNLSPSIIIFKEDFGSFYRHYRFELEEKLITIRELDGINATCYHCYYYDIYGNKLGQVNDKKDNYLIFSYEKNLFFSEAFTHTKGVINVILNKIIIPPIFNSIDIIDEENGVFCVSYLNIVSGYFRQETTGLYSEKEGFLIPFGSKYNFPEYCNNYFFYETPFFLDTKKDFIIYTLGDNKGLIFQGRKVLNADYNDIEGFMFCEKFDNTPDLCLDKFEVEKKTKEYNPLCVLLYKNDKYGLFYNTKGNTEKGYAIVEPIFDDYKCVKIYNGHAYFKVQYQDKFGIISDDYNFNKNSETEFDDVDFMEEISGECYFVIKKDGKTGALCTNEENVIPAIFDKIDKITKFGVICDKIFYNRKGVELFVLGTEYVYIETNYYDVFMGVGIKDDYKFINSEGKQISYTKDEDNEYILQLDGGRSFDTEENVFLEDEGGYFGEYDYGDDYDYERDTWNAMTDGQYGDMPEGFDGDYDFTGH